MRPTVYESPEWHIRSRNSANWKIPAAVCMVRGFYAWVSAFLRRSTSRRSQRDCTGPTDGMTASKHSTPSSAVRGSPGPACQEFSLTNYPSFNKVANHIRKINRVATRRCRREQLGNRPNRIAPPHGTGQTAAARSRTSAAITNREADA